MADYRYVHGQQGLGKPDGNGSMQDTVPDGMGKETSGRKAFQDIFRPALHRRSERSLSDNPEIEYFSSAGLEYPQVLLTLLVQTTETITQTNMKNRIAEKFQTLFQTEGEFFASAGRINLIGEHTD